MTTRFYRLAIVTGLTLAIGAAATAQTSETGPLTTKSGTIGAPAAGSGQVVFYRTGSLMGAALGCTVHEGAEDIARLGAGKYYVVAATPGKHEYFTTGEATDRITLEIEPDETYFVRCKIGMGVVAGRANLTPSDRATFADKGKGLAMWKNDKT